MTYAVTKDLLYALQRDLFRPPEWVMGAEVQVPYEDGLRFADAVFMSMSKHKGYEVLGCELKVSRGDWLNEVRKTGKGDPARARCDKWVLVLGDAAIARPDEVPLEWGIIAPGTDGRLTMLRQPSWLRPRDGPPEPMPRDFLAAWLTRVVLSNGMVPGFVAQLQREAEQRGYAKGLNAGKRQSPTVRGKDGKTKMRYNPARANLDDGEPLDLP